MSPRGAPRQLAGFFALYTVALVLPWVVGADRIRPFVLGFPFALFWYALWVALAFPVLIAADRVLGRDGEG
ncbi:MAG: hypothetical protein WEB88_14645 [Gemmatimonadota bacterium]